MNESLCKKCRGSRTVTCGIVSLGCYLTNKAGAHILCSILKLDLLSDGNTVVCNKRWAKFLLQHHVSALRAKCYFNSIGKLIYTAKKCGASLHTVKNFFRHYFYLSNKLLIVFLIIEEF